MDMSDQGEYEEMVRHDNYLSSLGRSSFHQVYCCISASAARKDHVEQGDKIIMPQSALDSLSHMRIQYPMIFELSNTSSGRLTHCGVLEFTAEEGLVILPQWMMENLHLEEGDRVLMKSKSLRKGKYIKLQPHTTDFIQISNPKAVLEKALRSFSCLTTGDTIMISFNNKKYLINVVETRPSAAVSIVETDCEVDFAPPLDYKEPTSQSAKPSPPPEVEEEEPERKKARLSCAFTGVGRRLDGNPVVSSSPLAVVSDPWPKEEPKAAASSSDVSRHHAGRLVFGSSSAGQSSSRPKLVKETKSKEQSLKAEPPKFQPFTGRKYTLNGNS